MNRFAFTAVLLVLCLAWGSPASAEIIVKRVKCSDANVFYPVFINKSSLAKNVTVQITRDGCFPKDESLAKFYLNTRNATGSTSSSELMPRLNKRTPAVYRSVAADWILNIFFQRSDFTDNVKGTFDYLLEVN